MTDSTGACCDVAGFFVLTDDFRRALRFLPAFATEFGFDWNESRWDWVASPIEAMISARQRLQIDSLMRWVLNCETIILTHRCDVLVSITLKPRSSQQAYTLEVLPEPIGPTRNAIGCKGQSGR